MHLMLLIKQFIQLDTKDSGMISFYNEIFHHRNQKLFDKQTEENVEVENSILVCSAFKQQRSLQDEKETKTSSINN